MKKVLSFLLVFMISLTLFGVTQDASAEAVDVTIYLHVHEFDGDYTNSGTGLWDGQNWNSYADVVTSTDSFGGVIEIAYTAAEVALIDDSIQFKPTSDTTVDNSETLLAPGNGEVYLDVTDLKAGSADGTMTELHVYYVEGGTEFYVKEIADNGLVMVVYVNPQVASDPEVYADWGMHIWNTGDPSSGTGVTWAEPHEFAFVGAVNAGEYTGIPAQYGAIEVNMGAENEFGFIVHKGDDKAWGSDIKIDSTISKAGGAEVVYYMHGTEDVSRDHAAFETGLAVGYKDSLKNKFIEGTIISSPTEIDVVFFGTKQPYDLVPSRFMVKDADGVEVPVASLILNDTLNVAPYTSDVTPQSETVVVVYVDTDIPAAQLGAVGSMQGWDIDNLLAHTAVDANGFVVFEFTSFDSEVAFKIKNDPDLDGFTWDGVVDPEVTPADVIVDLSAGGVVEVYIDGTTGAATTDFVVGQPVDPANYTYTAGTCAAEEVMLTVFVETALEHTQLGMVGTVNGWDIGNTIAPVGETTEGVPYWEVCLADTAEADDAGEFKVLFDTSDDGFAWSNADDPEVTPANVPFTIVEGEVGTALVVYKDLADSLVYEATATPVSLYRLSVYVIGGDAANLSITGGITDPQWNAAEGVAPTKEDVFGNVIFDLEVTSKTGEFKLFNNETEDPTDWAHSVTNDNITFDMGANNEGILVVDITDLENVVVTDLGNTLELDGNVASTFTLVLENELTYGVDYTVEYIEVPAEGETPAEILSWELDFATEIEFEEANVVDGLGTYAVLPTEIQIEWDNALPLMLNEEGTTMTLALKEIGVGEVTVDLANYMPMYSAGAYTPSNTCEEGNSMVYIHFNALGYEIADMAQLGAVGSMQGWNIDAPLNPVGMDDNGNYVFEMCLADTETAFEYKVLYDMSADGFAWGNEDDPELISANVAVTIADGPTFYSERGTNQLNVSKFHKIVLPEENKLDKASAYELIFTDASGFDVSIELDMDTVAPVVSATVNGVDKEVDDVATEFDLMDYFTILTFIDNREGDLGYVVETDIDLSVAGVQTLVISATDMWGNKSTFEIDVTVNDTTAPVITIDDEKTYEEGTDAPVWADFASTNEGTITIDESQVDMSTPGVFYVNYVAEDASGNQTLASLKVTITAAPDPEPTCDADQTLVDGECVDNEPEPEPSTGCFGSIGIGVTIVAVAALGGSALYFLRKQQ